MAETAAPHRFYGDLAEWWPLLSPPEDYVEEAAFAGHLLSSGSISVRDVLELGSGGGHNAMHLSGRYAMTLVDRSEAMLDVSRRLNPGCDHHLGDMRSVRLGRAFDAVFVHDAVSYMLTAADLRLAMHTAFVHCRPGGVVVLMPDDVAETFEERTEHGGTDGADGRGVRYLEWTWDPDPTDTCVSTEYAFVLRAPDGSVQVVHETHRTGRFSRDLWLALLAECGFVPSAVPEKTSEDRAPRETFVGRRPLHADGGSDEDR